MVLMGNDTFGDTLAALLASQPDGKMLAEMLGVPFGDSVQENLAQVIQLDDYRTNRKVK